LSGWDRIRRHIFSFDTALTLFSVFVGGLITFVTTILVESARKPRLGLTIKIPPYEHHQGGVSSKFLQVNVENKRLPGPLAWLSRNAAINCRATVTFHHLDGQPIFETPLELRWSSAPEPRPIQITLGDQTGSFIDLENFRRHQRADIHPGERDDLAVVVRFSNSDDCWGWSNNSYFCDPRWHDPQWRLQHGETFLALITVFSSGERVQSVFRVRNEGNYENCALLTALDDDLQHILAFA
jgi:hypothetical protein